MQFIKDGRLMIPLYHGTSTLFLHDILTKGLGAENPTKKYNIMETLKKLVNKGYEYSEYLPKSNWSPNSEHWLLKKNKMIVNNEIANHRYNGVYLTPSKLTAVRYTKNKYGSELISNTLILYHFLKEYSVPVDLDNEFLRHIMNCSYEPVVIIASSVDCSLLRSENNNKPIEDTFKSLQFFLEKGFDPQQTNFELPWHNIISPDNLTVLSVEEYKKIKEEHKDLFG
ncbi:hypothetical protein [Bacillus sp. Marseille-P3661]|uniref:hypothetical protein n=1 Tax=Bacillus sp. Marseille-P3661 TaxID=1936234 RepID=UPI000C8283D0|nr:hypothetical protein [Bacillus sp. Marseille-P3661]